MDNLKYVASLKPGDRYDAEKVTLGCQEAIEVLKENQSLKERLVKAEKLLDKAVGEMIMPGDAKAITSAIYAFRTGVEPEKGSEAERAIDNIDSGTALQYIMQKAIKEKEKERR